MTKSEAIELLKKDAKASVFFMTRPGPGFPFERYDVWLDEDGELVQCHPTEPGRRTCSAPETEYRVEA
jgi:hypothetical protein